MIYEVAAAVEHIVSLVPKTVGAEPIACFSSTLKDELETRCQACWQPSEPEHGSANRALNWQLHAAGEGADAAILTAITSVLAANENTNALLTSNTRRQQAVALALQWLPHSFTLWIDPGCVAIRFGPGPGSSSSFFDTNTKASSSAWSTSAIKVVWEAHSSLTQNKQTVSSIQFPTRSNVSRPIPIVRPTASVQPKSYQQHQRSVSTCSTASSVSASVPSQGLTRSVSLSSTSSASTEATSCSISLAANDKCTEDEDADVESDAPSCPHLTSPSEASTASSHAGDDADDTTVGNVTARFTGARLFDSLGQDEEDAGDVTLGAGDRTLLPGAIITASSTPKRISKVLSKPTVPLPAKSNYTTHDNGNVGVLGGGVRLGGMPAKPNGAVPAPRYRQHSHSHSLGHAQQPFFVPQQQYRLPQAAPYYPMNGGGGHYSVPARTVPLPTSHHYMQQPMRVPMQLQHYGSVPHLALAYNEQAYAAQHMAPRPAVSFALPAAGELTGEDGGDARRRVRSRGRRSRGRGAGRAARRQAAALRTGGQDGADLDCDDTDIDCDSDAHLTDADSNYSRCSTPATNSSASDYFASPAKSAHHPASQQHHHRVPTFAMPMAV